MAMMQAVSGRSLRRERGLKLRGISIYARRYRRSLRRERGLKHIDADARQRLVGRSLRRERGLKLARAFWAGMVQGVAPFAGSVD